MLQLRLACHHPKLNSYAGAKICMSSCFVYNLQGIMHTPMYRTVSASQTGSQQDEMVADSLISIHAQR